jgi:hypothetical protein
MDNPEIYVQCNDVDVDLHQVLTAVFAAATGFAWHITAHDWTGPDEATFGRIVERGAWLTDDELLSIARLNLHLIDAGLTGCDAQRKTPQVIVRAVNGTWWDVESNDPAILDAIRLYFPTARAFPTN